MEIEKHVVEFCEQYKIPVRYESGQTFMVFSIAENIERVGRIYKKFEIVCDDKGHGSIVITQFYDVDYSDPEQYPYGQNVKVNLLKQS